MIVGFLILGGAVNTAIVGSTGVLMRVAEDGVLSDWFRKPQRKYGTSYRIVNLVAGLQMFTIIVLTRGNVIMLGEAYAFGVIWSFTFNALAMLVLRWKYQRRTRLEGSTEHADRQDGDTSWTTFGISGSVDYCDRESIYQIRSYE